MEAGNLNVVLLVTIFYLIRELNCCPDMESSRTLKLLNNCKFP